jgi:hypothetical protein
MPNPDDVPENAGLRPLLQLRGGVARRIPFHRLLLSGDRDHRPRVFLRRRTPREGSKRAEPPLPLHATAQVGPAREPSPRRRRSHRETAQERTMKGILAWLIGIPIPIIIILYLLDVF